MTDTTEIDDFVCLRHSPLSVGLTDDQLRALTEVTFCRRLKDQEILIEEGKIDNSLHIVTEGAIAVTKDLGSGDYTTIHVLKTGDMAGEMGFVSGRPHSATLRSLGRTQVCSFERERFESLLENEPWLVYQVMRNIVRATHDILRSMNAQYIELTKYVSQSHGRY
jgi:CRP-like cAMP-binding protein